MERDLDRDCVTDALRDAVAVRDLDAVRADDCDAVPVRVTDCDGDSADAVKFRPQ